MKEQKQPLSVSIYVTFPGGVCVHVSCLLKETGLNGDFMGVT